MSVVQNVQWTRHIITVHLCQRRGQKHPRCCISGTAITHSCNLWRIRYNPFCVSNTAATYLFLSSWKKCTYFQCPLACTQPKKWQVDRAGTKRLAAQPLASYSKSSRGKKKKKKFTDSSIIPAMLGMLSDHPWHSECCQITGNASPPPEGLSWACRKLKFPGRHEYRALQHLDMMGERTQREPA